MLVGAGLWTPGSGVPRDDGIITQLRSEGLIAPGVGKGPVEVTLWDRPTVHIFMNIDGRFFGTSDGADGGDANGGAGWLYDGAPDTLKPAFKPYHLLRSALRGSTSSGQSFGFLLSAAQWKIGGLVTGEKVHVRYKELASGAMVATAVSYPGSVTATGTVASLGPRAGSFTIQTPDGPALTLSTVSPSPLLGGVVPGDTVRVTYSKVRTELIAHAVKVTATPATSTGTSAGGTGAGGMSLGPSG